MVQFIKVTQDTSGTLIGTNVSTGNLVEIPENKIKIFTKAYMSGSIVKHDPSSGREYSVISHDRFTKLYNKRVKQDVDLNLVKMEDLKFDPSVFVPMKTNTPMDTLFSTKDGIMPGTNIMLTGAPGVGKTTLILYLLSQLQKDDKRVLFISGEMNQIDMAEYTDRFPQFSTIPILFLGDYTEDDPRDVIEKTLDMGWDVVLTDSYTEVNDTVKDQSNITSTKAEKWFLNLMNKHNLGENSNKSFTTFLTILQISKGGKFVGSNKLKHMTTAMFSIDFEGKRRYIEFSKNRRGMVGQKLYFSLNDGIRFDSNRLNLDLEAAADIKSEDILMESDKNEFDDFISKLAQETQDEEINEEEVANTSDNS